MRKKCALLSEMMTDYLNTLQKQLHWPRRCHLKRQLALDVSLYISIFAKLGLSLMSNPQVLVQKCHGKKSVETPNLVLPDFFFKGKRPRQLYLFWNVKSKKSKFNIHDTQLLLPSDCSRTQRINTCLSLQIGVWMLLVLPFRSTCVCVFLRCE